MVKGPFFDHPFYLPWSANQDVPSALFLVKKMEVNRRCQNCGVWVIENWSYGLHVHHIDRNPNNNEDENLIVLCATCHRDRHAGRGWEI